MKISHKVAANTIVQVLGKIILAFISFAITLLVAGNYGVRGFGDFIKITSYTANFYLLVDFGFNAVVLQYIAKKEKKENFYFKNLLIIRIYWALFLTLAAVLIAAILPFNKFNFWGFPPAVKTGIFIMSFTILLQGIFITANVIFQKYLRYDRPVIAAVAGGIINLVLLAFLIYLRAPLLLSLLSFIAGDVLMVLVSLYFLGTGRRLKAEDYIETDLWKKLFKDALPLGITLVFNIIYFRADIFILTFFRSTEDVGIYGLAYKIFELPLVAPIFFMNSMYPLLLKKEFGSRNYELGIIKKSLIFLVLTSLFLIFIYFFFSPLLTFIKPEFGRSMLPLRILSLSFPLFFPATFFVWYLIAKGKQKILSLIYGGFMAFNILLNIIFIPKYSYAAAAWITVFVELLVLLTTGLVSFRIMKKSYNRN